MERSIWTDAVWNKPSQENIIHNACSSVKCCTERTPTKGIRSECAKKNKPDFKEEIWTHTLYYRGSEVTGVIHCMYFHTFFLYWLVILIFFSLLSFFISEKDDLLSGMPLWEGGGRKILEEIWLYEKNLKDIKKHKDKTHKKEEWCNMQEEGLLFCAQWNIWVRVIDIWKTCVIWNWMEKGGYL